MSTTKVSGAKSQTSNTKPSVMKFQRLSNKQKSSAVKFAKTHGFSGFQDCLISNFTVKDGKIVKMVPTKEIKKTIPAAKTQPEVNLEEKVDHLEEVIGEATRGLKEVKKLLKQAA